MNSDIYSNFSSVLNKCEAPEDFKELFRVFHEEVKAHPSLVFKRLEAAQNFTDSFYADLQDEIGILLNAMPSEEPKKVELSKISCPVRSMEEVEREHILYAVRYFDYDVFAAAKALGMCDRSIRNKLDNYVGKRTRLPNGTLKYLILNLIAED